MPSDYKYVSEYWKKFLGYKKELESIGSFPEKNSYWIEMYSEWAENHRNKTGLELALSNITGLNLLQALRHFSIFFLFPTTLSKAISLKITFLLSLLKSATLWTGTNFFNCNLI